MPLKTLFRNFESLSLKKKIFSLVLFNAITISICAFIGFQFCKKTYNELLFNSIAGNLSFSSTNISNKFRSIENMSSLILSSSTLQTQLGAVYESNDAIVKSEANQIINNSLLEYYNSYRNNKISYITLYNTRFYNSTNFALLNKTDKMLINKALNNAKNEAGGIAWTYSPGNNYIFLSREIRRIKNLSLSPIGYLLVAIDIGKIVEDSNKAVTMYEDAQYIILGQDNNLIYASKELTTEDTEYLIHKLKSSYEILTITGHSYFAVLGNLPDYDYKYINLIPFDAISSTLRLSLNMMVFIIILGFVLIALLSKRLLNLVFNQFNDLIRKMQAFSENEMTTPQSDMDYTQQTDEIGMLHQQFDQMSIRIQNLIKTNYINEILTKDSKIKALESQMSPHFLYNTLESMNWRAKASGNSEISQMAESLGRLLRSTLSNKESLVTIAYEMELVNAYINIQNIRYKDRLAYHSSVDESLMDAKIPPLTIQPLLENAFRYGLEETSDVCHIIVKAYLTESILTIQVMNEASYFESNLLEMLQANSRTPNGFGIGLTNIDQRIKLLFDERYGLTLSNKDGYAIASITIPYQKK